MKKATALLALLFSVVCQPLFAECGPIVDNTMQAFMAKNDVPGAAVAILDHGKTSLCVYGVANQATRTPITEHTLFEIASVTKVFTTLLLAQDIESGQLSLDSPLNQFMPKLDNHYFNELTLEELATHTSALPRDLPAHIHSQAGLENYLLRTWHPGNTIGKQWEYSNVGFGLLGDALKNENHEGLNRLYLSRIMEPLGMDPIGMTVPKNFQKNIARGYTGRDRPDYTSPKNLQLLPSAWAIKASIADMGDFLSAAAEASGTPAMKSAMELTETPLVHVETGHFDQALGWTVRSLRDPSALVYLPKSTLPKTRSMEWLPKNKQRFDGDALIDKTGTTESFRAYIAVIPDEKSGVVLLTNKYVRSNTALLPTARKILFDTLGIRVAKEDHPFAHRVSQVLGLMRRKMLGPELTLSEA